MKRTFKIQEQDREVKEERERAALQINLSSFKKETFHDYTQHSTPHHYVTFLCLRESLELNARGSAHCKSHFPLYLFLIIVVYYLSTVSLLIS